MDKKFDFYKIGNKFAKENLEYLKYNADEIMHKYGEAARVEFEAGVAAVIPAYANFDVHSLSTEEVKETFDLGVLNLHNNEYQGGRDEKWCN